MSGDRAPVALFAFRRPEHLERTVAALARARGAAETDLIVFCDGPRNADDEDAVQQVRDLARSLRGFASVTVHEAEANRGLAASVIAGVDTVLDGSDTVIVLEDDMIVAPDFLDYMQAGLHLYADSPSVVSIHGYCPSSEESLPDSFFLRGADCWGWATWRRGWSLFDPDGAGLLRDIESRGLEREFDIDGAYPYTRMLRDQVAGRIDSWAIRWYASAFLRSGLTLYPGVTRVRNIGQDGSGTHGGSSRDEGDDRGFGELKPLQAIPVREVPEVRAAYARALRSLTPRPGIRSRVRRVIGR
jgi:hypothetical protein